MYNVEANVEKLVSLAVFCRNIYIWKEQVSDSFLLIENFLLIMF